MIIFFELLRDWGASRAGAYAFISPVISVLVGVVLLGETVTGVQAIGMLCLLVATTLAVFR